MNTIICIINCYDPVNNSWSSPINTHYYYFAMITLNDKLLISGGEDKSGSTNNGYGQLKIKNCTITRSYATATGYQGMPICIITGGKYDKGKNLLYMYKFLRDVIFTDYPNLGFLQFYFRGSLVITPYISSVLQ